MPDARRSLRTEASGVRGFGSPTEGQRWARAQDETAMTWPADPTPPTGAQTSATLLTRPVVGSRPRTHVRPATEYWKSTADPATPTVRIAPGMAPAALAPRTSARRSLGSVLDTRNNALSTRKRAGTAARSTTPPVATQSRVTTVSPQFSCMGRELAETSAASTASGLDPSARWLHVRVTGSRDHET